uniref:Ribosomal_L7Ae domain-containing protein n=2 Tax=Ascaris TaxID=6251 RepID=A0A0M3HUM2_ASCLU
MYCQQNFFVQHSSWTAGGYTFHQSSTVALSNLMVVRGGTMGSPNAISQQQNINSEIKKPVERKAKKGISPLKKAILRDKSERCFNEVGGAQEGGASSGNSNQICGSVTAPSPTLLDTAILKLLKKLKSFYDRAYKRNPVKAKSKRRFVYGLHEVRRHLVLSTARCVVLAKDIEYVSEKEKLGSEVATVRKLCEENNVPLLEFSKKHKLGNALNARPFVSAVAVLDYSGAEDLYFVVMEVHKQKERSRRIGDHEDQPSLLA